MLFDEGFSTLVSLSIRSFIESRAALTSNLIMQNFLFLSLVVSLHSLFFYLFFFSVREWPTKIYFYCTIKSKCKELHRRVITRSLFLSHSLSGPRISRNRIDYQRWQILSLMPLVVVVSFLLHRRRYLSAVILDSTRSSDSLCTFSVCKVSSTSGSNYFSCELRFLAVAAAVAVVVSLFLYNSLFQSTIAQYFWVALKE